MFFNMHKDNFSRLDADELFTLDDIKSSLSEVLEREKIFVIDLAIFIEEVNKRVQCPEEINKDDLKYLKGLWEGFQSETLVELRELCSDEQIRNVIKKMLILKTAYRKLNEEMFSIDLEDYFIPREKLIEIAL